jgi:predicted ATPase
MKFTRYFTDIQKRPDRAAIRLDWIQQAVDHPIKETIQSDGRIRRWAQISAMDGRYLRVILLADGETIHNAFFDRTFRP